MPPRPAAPHGFQIGVIWQNAAGINRAANVMKGQALGTSSSQLSIADCLVISNAFWPTTGTTGFRRFLFAISDLWSVIRVTVSDLGGSENQDVSVTPATGASATVPFPPQVAVCLSWSINAKYRGGKPRTYLPGVAGNNAADTNSSALSNTFCTTLAAAGVNFIADMAAVTIGGQPLTMGCWAYTRGGAPLTTPTFSPFTNALVHERMDSQRRRSGKESGFGVI